MSLKAGIVGLPNSGKTTLFNVLTAHRALTASYPFSTIESNQGVVSVPDHRLATLKNILNPPRVVSATVEFLDVAGLVKGASQGEGLGNRFLAEIRGVDALVMVLRFFADAQVTHVMGTIDPFRDREVIDLELMLADLEVLKRRLKKHEELSRKLKDRALLLEIDLLHRCHDLLEAGQPLRHQVFSREEEEILRESQMLTRKPVVYVANCDEVESTRLLLEQAIEHQVFGSDSLIPVYCRLEEELGELPDHEKGLFLEEYGIESSGLSQLIKEVYRCLGLLTFFTFGDKELRAWEIVTGSTAPSAAGKVHTDMEKGFIRAEVINIQELEQIGSLEKARQSGKIRLEGKEYQVRDGDLLYFRFSPP